MAASAIAQLIIEQGRQAAEARAAQGQVWGRAVENLGQLPAHMAVQQREQQALDMQRQELQARTALQGQQFQSNAMDLAAKQKSAQNQTLLDQIWADPSTYNPDGSINRQGIQQKVSQQVPHLWPAVSKTVDDLEASREAIQQKAQALQTAHQDALGQDARGLAATGNDPGTFHLIVSARSKDGSLTPDEANHYLDTVKTPDDVAAVTKGWIASSKSASAEEQAAHKPVVVPEGGTLIDPATGKQIGTAGTKPKDEFQTFKDSYPQTLGLKTWEQLSPLQKDAGISKFAELKSDPAVKMQNQRIAEQNLLQQHSQTFQEQQAGRKELTEKVEQPYQTALASANTMRDVVAAAQAGNKVAGSLQSLETTMAAIRAQGLNRINTAEIGVTADAGNLWDRIVGWVGKKAEGQPVPANIQKDMTEFASILEKAAYKKYAEGHAAVTGRYKLADEKPMPPPGSMTPPSAVRSKYKVTVE